MRNILLCLCGLTPQIITETIYALVKLENPPYVPDEVHVITTGIGKMLIKEKLLHPDQGHFYALCQEYGLKNILFDDSTIHVVSKNNQELFDIKDNLDNQVMADCILSVVKNICSDPEVKLHASLAGGRKSMSFYLGMAMQFYARPQDELSHILVNPPFENHPDFYYPPKIPKDYTVYDKLKDRLYTSNSSEAKIVLAKIPFLKLRDQILVKTEDISFSKQVASVQKILSKQKTSLLFVYPQILTIQFRSNSLTLTPMEMAIYLQLIKNKQKCSKKICDHCYDCFIEVYNFSLEQIYNFLRTIWGEFSARLESVQKRFENRVDLKDWFLQNKSRINKKLATIDPKGEIQIKSYGSYGSKRYGILVNKKDIVIL
ncbi:MAG: CRISPR-associated ring nuclease Csm6 [Desulfonauticus sp.]|nr:CRISPR-associated ring nuclease Csm6 [Desulfonauticus sp.]